MKHRTVSLLALLSLGLGVPSIATHAATPVCGRLCTGSWHLDAEASTDADEALEDALDDYKEEKIRIRVPRDGDLASLEKAELEESLGPLRRRPRREELQGELKRRLDIPALLRVSQDGRELRIDEGRGGPRRFDLEESYSRVDSLGTAEVKAKLSGNSFTITEKYGKGRSNSETYTVEAKTGLLVVTRSFTRPALPLLLIRSVYKPAP